MKYIPVTSCENCPHIRHDDGGGYCGVFKTCNAFNILLVDEDEDIWMDIATNIHKDCQLKDCKEVG